MNTAGSVAYGWGALIVAAGVSFYYAKKEIDVRRKDAQLKGTRPMEKLSWEDRIKAHEQNVQAAQTSTPSPALAKGQTIAGTPSQPPVTSKAGGGS